MPARPTSIPNPAHSPNSSLRCRDRVRHKLRHDPEKWKPVFGQDRAQIYWRQELSVYILVVDDEPDVEALFRQQFRRDLKSGRFTMEFAPSAPAALLRAAEIRDPSLILILSDINMPGMSGLEMLPRVRAERPDVPVIMITAYGDAETRRKAIERGAVGLLTKPIDFAELQLDIDKTIRHVEMMRDARRREAEAERAHASLSRYFSPQIASRLACDGESDGMEIQAREIATIFTDITSFTTLVENTAPEVLAALLGEYMGGMTDIVFAHEGTVAKIIGDSVHILFNAPGDPPHYATRAVACARDLDAWAEH